MIPANDDWRIKLWGKTKCVAYSPRGTTHQAHAVERGFSSRHYHPDQANTFFVLFGSLRVETWVGERPIGVPHSIVTLAPTQAFTVPAGTWHRFVALTPVAVIELYDHPPRPAEGDVPPDIVRYDEGGVGAPPYGQAHDREQKQ